MIKSVMLFVYILLNVLSSINCYASRDVLVGFGDVSSGTIGSNGMICTVNGFYGIDFDKSPLEQKLLSSDVYNISPSAIAFDTSSKTLFVQSIINNDIYLVSINTGTGKETSRVKINIPFKFFVYDPKGRFLFGLAGYSGGSFGYFGISVSGTGFYRLNPNTGDTTQITVTNRSYIINSISFDSSSNTLYIQRLTDFYTIHLVSINTITGSENSIISLEKPFMQFELIKDLNLIYGFKGDPIMFLPDGFTYKSSFIANIDLSTKKEIILKYTDGTYRAFSSAYDSNEKFLYIQKIENNNLYLSAINILNNNESILLKLDKSFANYVLKNHPPSELTLARLCEQTYVKSWYPLPPIDGYINLIVPGTDGAYNFSAKVYKNDRQVVIAFRGTILDSLFSEIKDILADTPFTTGIVTVSFRSKLSQAVDLLITVMNIYNNSYITLTGHSLGGAIAQILGDYTGLPTVTFNAPRPGALMAQVNNVLSPLQPYISKFNKGDNLSLRMYGDGISVLGSPLENVKVKTIAASNDLRPLAGNWSTALKSHEISYVVTQLYSGANQTAGYDGPWPLKDRLRIAQPITLLYLGLNFFVASATVSYGIDPYPGHEYEFISAPGSVFFSSIVLPQLRGVASYRIQTIIGNQWGPSIAVSPFQNIVFEQPVSGIRFWPLDRFGNRTSISDVFIFDVSFASTGLFNGTIKIKTRNDCLPYLKLLLLD